MLRRYLKQSMSLPIPTAFECFTIWRAQSSLRLTVPSVIAVDASETKDHEASVPSRCVLWRSSTKLHGTAVLDYLNEYTGVRW